MAKEHKIRKKCWEGSTQKLERTDTTRGKIGTRTNKEKEMIISLKKLRRGSKPWAGWTSLRLVLKRREAAGSGTEAASHCLAVCV